MADTMANKAARAERPYYSAGIAGHGEIPIDYLVVTWCQVAEHNAKPFFEGLLNVGKTNKIERVQSSVRSRDFQIQ